MLHSCNPKNIIEFPFSTVVMTQADSDNRHVAVSNRDSQVIIDVTLEN